LTLLQRIEAQGGKFARSDQYTFSQSSSRLCSNFRVLDIPLVAAARSEKEKSITTAAHSSAVAAFIYLLLSLFAASARPKLLYCCSNTPRKWSCSVIVFRFVVV
jgi:tRNA C32,U32 (ribose-2'-O)-methylase TrmJ